jgi:hypothetical protein
VAKISAQELAELVPCRPENVSRLQDLGLLEARDDGLFSSSDVHVVRLMAAFEEACISLEDVARGVASEEIRPRPSLTRISRASCKEQRKRTAAGRSSGWATA